MLFFPVFFLSILPFGLFAADSSSLTTNDAPIREWTVLNDLANENQRKSFLGQKVREGMMRQLSNEAPLLQDIYFSNTEIGNYGVNFSYLGSIEQEFLSYLQSTDEDNTTKKTALIPGCGFGKIILDGLKKTKSYNFIANDLAENAINTLGQAIDTWFPRERGRVTKKAQDIFELLPTLESESIDAIFCTNLIHFFDPSQFELFLKESQRVLKPKGKIFISWDGYDSFRKYKLDPLLKPRIELINKLQSLGLKYITYGDHTLFPKELQNDVMKIKNFIPKAEVVALADNFGLTQTSYQKYSFKYEIIAPRPMLALSLENKCFYYGETIATEDMELKGFYSDALTLQKTKAPILTTKSTYSDDFTSGHWKAKLENYRCDQCQIIVKNIQKCSACKRAKYCNQSCQKEAWKSHKNSCKKN